MGKPDWREDIRWHLVEWDIGYWTSAPKRPTPQAEIVGGGSWCAHFIQNRPVATWALHERPQHEPGPSGN